MFQAAYLAKAGRSVAVLEKRHVVGGAAVTEEIVPGTEETRRQWTPHSAAVSAVGFKFSRASYVLSLLRPQIVKDLELKVQPFFLTLLVATSLPQFLRNTG